jgi:recombinational DNA repair protein RecR
LFGETQIYSKDNVAASAAVPDRKEEDEERGPCYFCRNLETGHKCKLCSKRCCNICNKVTIVEEMDDNICPECFEEYKFYAAQLMFGLVELEHRYRFSIELAWRPSIDIYMTYTTYI